MKKPQILISLLASATLFAASNLNAATTDPVGYITLTVNGTGGVGSSAVSVLGAPIESVVSATGTITDVSGNTITSASSGWVVSDFANTHYVRITSGTNSGIITTITANTSTTLTTSEDISSLVANGNTLEIRGYTTLAGIFGGANEAGLGSGADFGAADEVLIFNGTNFDIFYYQEGAAFGGDGWRSSTNKFVDASATPVPPGLSIVVKRKATDPIDIVLSGSLLNSDTFIPVENGVNWMSGAHPIDYSLSGYFGANGGSLQKGADFSSADEILVPKIGGGFDIYYYQEGAAFGGDGFRSSTNKFVDVSTTTIASVGSGFVLKRKGSEYNQLDDTPLDD